MRLYNGCPDYELAAIWESRENVRKNLGDAAKKLFGEEADARITYYPAEGKYIAWIRADGRYRELSDFCDSVESCASKAIETLKNTSNLKSAEANLPL